jgi:hypothetical protein
MDRLPNLLYRRSRTRHENGGTVIGTWRDSDGARTPEELETLLEDALLRSDEPMLAALFAPRSTLVTGQDRPAHGRCAIVRAAFARWGEASPYLADLHRVVVAGDVALILARHGIHVACRSYDHAWRYAIVLHLGDEDSTGGVR